MIKRILLDIDDVLNQFTMLSLKIAGCKVDPMDNSMFPVEVGYDIVAACNLLHPTVKDWTPQEYWGMMPQSAWSHTPKSPECDWIIKTCAKLVGQDNVFLCTSATTDPASLAGKLMWIHHELPTCLHRQYVITPVKYLCANPTTLLIDDNDANCKSFSAHGGNVLLVPKPWNTAHRFDTQAVLTGFFEQFAEQAKRIVLEAPSC